nr:hypothetical protein GCM10020093_041190 [Planobispora longispora]
MLLDELPVPLDVAVVVGERLGAEADGDPELGVVAHRVDAVSGAALVEPDLPVFQAEEVVRAEDRQVGAQVVEEPLLLAEDEPAHVRVQSVGAHHEVELPGRAAVEAGQDAVPVLPQRGDGVAEDVLDVVARELVHHPDEVLAQQLDVVVVEPPPL